jgi:acetyltransferase-like isoleucine patch superfamily enzyme
VNGNVKIGDAVWIGPGATISDGLTVADSAHVALGSAVMRDVMPNERVIGSIALPQGRMLRMMASIGKKA